MLPSVTKHSSFTKSVVTTDTCQKCIGVVRRVWSERLWTVLVGYVTISVNVSCYQTCCKGQIPLCCPARWQVTDQLANQLARELVR